VLFQSINLVHSKFTEAFFCNIIDIHSNVFVKLSENSECDCSVFYLYRTIRRHNSKNYLVDNIKHLPACYRNLLIEDSKSIERLENSCEFSTRVRQCRSQSKRHHASSFISAGKCKWSDASDTNAISDYDFAFVDTSSEYQHADSSLFSSFSTLSIVIVVITVILITMTFVLIAIVIEIKGRGTLYESDLDDSSAEKSVSATKYFSFIRKKNSSKCLSSNSASFLIGAKKKPKKCLIVKMDKSSANKTLLEMQAEDSMESNQCAKTLNFDTTII